MSFLLKAQAKFDEDQIAKQVPGYRAKFIYQSTEELTALLANLEKIPAPGGVSVLLNDPATHIQRRNVEAQKRAIRAILEERASASPR